MRILLFGDFSCVHKYLKEGLEELGHNALLVSTGDDFKNIPSDISLRIKNNILGKIKGRIKPFLYLNKFYNYDVVQLINPYFLHHKFFPTFSYYKLLKLINKKFFLLACGSDAYYWRYGPKVLNYGPFKDVLKFDIKSNQIHFQDNKSFNFNEKVANLTNGIIPNLYEYERCYQDHPKLLPLIPLPINLKTIEYKDNIPEGKLKILHGISRYGFKGSRHIEKAFSILEKKYPDEVEFYLPKKLSLDKYLKLMHDSNVVIDQTNFYSYGMNALQALAMGKVVLSGNEPSAMKAMKISNSPIINVLPDHNDILKKIEFLIQEKNSISNIGFESRKFVEKNHDHIEIAKKYIKTWS